MTIANEVPFNGANVSLFSVLLKRGVVGWSWGGDGRRGEGGGGGHPPLLGG